MVKVYEQAKDLHVRGLIVYGKRADLKLYLEEAFATQINQVEAEDAFEKGVLFIQEDAVLRRPVSMSANKISTVMKTGSMSAAFDATKTYAIGDFVTKDSKVYKCKTAIEVAAAWDVSKWDESTVLEITEWESVATV